MTLVHTPKRHSAEHKARMERKAKARQDWYERNGNQPFPTSHIGPRGLRYRNVTAGQNRRTGKPHLHQREIARRLRQGS